MRAEPGEIRAAGLVFSHDDEPGFSRRRRGRGFSYHDEDGRPLRDERHLARIRSLVIPPAWTNVWICRRANGHLQATGRDAKGRKQYRYHPAFRALRDETKYARLPAFIAALPRLRRRVSRDLGQRRLTRERVLAAAVRVLEETHMRPGHEEYTRENGSYGLTTLTHAQVCGLSSTKARFCFIGKHGHESEVELKDPRVARVIFACTELPEERLFAYVDDAGEIQHIDSHDLNEYVRSATGGTFTAKDFRTFAGTLETAVFLAAQEPPRSKTEARRVVLDAVRHTAERLRHRPATCRKFYIHPAVLDAFEEGRLRPFFDEHDDAEAALLALLEGKPRATRRRAA